MSRGPTTTDPVRRRRRQHVLRLRRHQRYEIIGGDWIGLGRGEVIHHGWTFLNFLESLAKAPT